MSKDTKDDTKSQSSMFEEEGKDAFFGRFQVEDPLDDEEDETNEDDEEEYDEDDDYEEEDEEDGEGEDEDE